MLISICCTPAMAWVFFDLIQISGNTHTRDCICRQLVWCWWFGWCIASIDNMMNNANRRELKWCLSRARFDFHIFAGRPVQGYLIHSNRVYSPSYRREDSWVKVALHFRQLAQTQRHSRHKCWQSESKLLPWFRPRICVILCQDANDSLDKLSAISSKSFVDCCVLDVLCAQSFVNKATLDWLWLWRTQPTENYYTSHSICKEVCGRRKKWSPYTHKMSMCIVRKCGTVATQKRTETTVHLICCVWKQIMREAQMSICKSGKKVNNHGDTHAPLRPP